MSESSERSHRQDVEKMGVIKLIVKCCLGSFFLLLTSIIIVPTAAYSKDQVNVLGWWGYLDSEEIQEEIEKKCNVSFSYDEYYSNDEFLRRWNNSKKGDYDIIIFSETIYNVVRDRIDDKNGELYKEKERFLPIIKKRYEQKRFASNVLFFAHSLTGFLWNPRIITLSDSDDIKQIFYKAKGKYKLLIDDPVEVGLLVEEAYRNESNSGFTMEKFFSLMRD